MDYNKLFQSKLFKGVILGIAALTAILLVLKAGMIIGAKKADFSHKWSDNYHQNFAGPKNGFLTGFGDRDFMESNGVFGQIIKMGIATTSAQENTIVVRGRGDMEKIILIKDNTVIKLFQKDIKPAGLKVDDYIVVIGEPNDSGQIEAKLIRVMPQPPTEGQLNVRPKGGSR